MRWNSRTVPRNSFAENFTINGFPVDGSIWYPLSAVRAVRSQKMQSLNFHVWSADPLCAKRIFSVCEATVALRYNSFSNLDMVSRHDILWCRSLIRSQGWFSCYYWSNKMNCASRPILCIVGQGQKFRKWSEIDTRRDGKMQGEMKPLCLVVSSNTGIIRTVSLAKIPRPVLRPGTRCRCSPFCRQPYMLVVWGQQTNVGNAGQQPLLKERVVNGS